jgi:hypothetical protein
VGLIEYNRYKFDVVENDLEEKPASRPYTIKGLRVVKRARYRNLPQFHIDHTISMIAQRRTSNQKETYNMVIEGLTNPELVYNLAVQ